MLSKTLLLCSATLLFALAARAELRWEKPIQEFERTPDDRSVEAHFAFRNGGSAPVTIKSIKTSCGCTTARLEKKTYAPGEGGEVTAVFSFGGRKGPHRKTVTVTTEDGAEPQVLDIRLFVYEPFDVKPALVFWRTGETADAKAVRLTANGRPIKIRSINSSSPRLSAKLETVRPGEEYLLAIKPADTAQKEAAQIVVETDFPRESPRSYTIYARVK